MLNRGADLITRGATENNNCGPADVDADKGVSQ